KPFKTKRYFGSEFSSQLNKSQRTPSGPRETKLKSLVSRCGLPPSSPRLCFRETVARGPLVIWISDQFRTMVRTAARAGRRVTRGRQVVVAAATSFARPTKKREA